VSRYLDHLPPVFREDDFAGQFLLAFEAVLSGYGDVEGLAQIVGRVADYLDPRTAPAEFLPWLAGWVALGLRADWDEDTQRGFIAEIVPLYRRRGTAAGLQRMLEIYLRPLDDEVTRDDVRILTGATDPPHFFQVLLTLSDANPARLRRTQEIARAIIDREKPAHTFYALKVVIPTMRLVSPALKQAEKDVPELLELGRNTWLGSH
jgi:phage tail-like protein